MNNMLTEVQLSAQHEQYNSGQLTAAYCLVYGSTYHRWKLHAGFTLFLCYVGLHDNVMQLVGAGRQNPSHRVCGPRALCAAVGLAQTGDAPRCVAVLAYTLQLSIAFIRLYCA